MLWPRHSALILELRKDGWQNAPSPFTENVCLSAVGARQVLQGYWCAVALPCGRRLPLIATAASASSLGIRMHVIETGLHDDDNVL